MTAGTMMPPMRSTRDGEPCGAAHNVPINGNQGEGRFRPANVSPDRAKAGDGSQWTLEETSHLDPHLDRYGRHGTNPEYPHQLCQPRRSLLAELHVYPSNSGHAGRAFCSPSFIFNPSSFFILVFFLRLSLSLPSLARCACAHRTFAPPISHTPNHSLINRMEARLTGPGQRQVP